MGALQMTRELEPFGPAAALILTDAEVDELGGGRRAAVRVTIGGRTARLRLAVMGGRNCIGLSKAARAELGVDTAQTVVARVELDDEPRDVELPDELRAALEADPGLRTTFEAMAYSHRKEYARWVGEAKRPETRERRLAQALEMIREGRTRT
ncbi:MAG: YdeI/OmpD-associated family protein [Dermatophilaceae bacterium]